jgi:hypothetical protein
MGKFFEFLIAFVLLAFIAIVVFVLIKLMIVQAGKISINMILPFLR